jgi:CPA1 family monovalent cation:H+ antiporter
VISTVISGILLGNYGRSFAMNPKTTETVESFFESIDFLINSILFIMIGLELQAMPDNWLADHAGAVVKIILIVLVTRCLVVYPCYHLVRLRRAGDYPKAWAHVLNLGGLRGSIPIALLLGLPDHEAINPYREILLITGFAMVCFSLVVQGMSIRPLLLKLNITVDRETDESDSAHHQDGLK